MKSNNSIYWIFGLIIFFFVCGISTCQTATQGLNSLGTAIVGLALIALSLMILVTTTIAMGVSKSTEYYRTSKWNRLDDKTLSSMFNDQKPKYSKEELELIEELLVKRGYQITNTEEE